MLMEKLVGNHCSAVTKNNDYQDKSISDMNDLGLRKN